MRRWIGGAACAVMLAASPAVAQDEPETPRPEVVAAAGEIIGKLDVLLELVGLEDEIMPSEQLIRAIDAAIPIRSPEEGGSWSSGFRFDFETETSPGELEPRPDGAVVHTDARACLEEGEEVEIVSFQRLSRGGLRGHRCVLFLRGSTDDVWLILARGFAEGPGRRLSTYYGAAMAIEGDRDTARRLLAERLDANIALADAIGDYALEMLLLKPREGGRQMSAEDALARIERFRARLEAMADDAATAPAGAP